MKQTDDYLKDGSSKEFTTSYSKIIKVLLFVVLEIVIITGSVFVGTLISKNQRTVTQPVSIQPSPATTSLSQEQAAVANGIEYFNDNWNISFKYPQTWSVEEKQGELLVCPNDFSENQESATECFTVKKETRSLTKYIYDLEQENGYAIFIAESDVRYSNGNRIYHIFREGNTTGNRLSVTYITNLKDNSVSVTSATAWNDYSYHLEPYILDTLRFLK